MSSKIIKKRFEITGELIQFIQTEEDIIKCKNTSQLYYSGIIYKGKKVTDKNKINKIMSSYPGDSNYERR